MPWRDKAFKKKTKKPGVTFMCNKMARIFFLSLYKRASHCTSNKKKSSVTIGKYSMVSLVLGAMMVFMKHIYFCFLKSMLYLELVWLLWEREKKKENKREKSEQKITDKPCLVIQITMHSLHIQTDTERERQAKVRYSSFPHCVIGFVLPRTPNQPFSRWSMHVKRKQL